MTLLTRSNIVQLDPSEISEWIFQGNIAQYLQVATATVLLYDTSEHTYLVSEIFLILSGIKVTTMDKEV